MTGRGSQSITWDLENRMASVSDGGTSYSYTYDGDGKRIKKVEAGSTTVYVNKYYEKNLTTSTETSNYYLGDRLVVVKKGSTLEYLHQDHLSSTSVSTDGSGAEKSRTLFYPFGTTRSSTGTLGTEMKFTGQRLDGTGLYFYSARYYDPTIGRFLSPDTEIPSFMNAQSLNRYSYVLNNPLKYTDPTGHWPSLKSIGKAVASAARVVSRNVAVVQTALDVAGMVPGIGEVFDLASAVISVSQGDWTGAALSMASMVPGVGNIAGAAKIANRVDDVVGLAKASDNVPASLLKGEKDSHVYLGIKDGNEVYAGISKDVARREAQHGDKFDKLQQITDEPLTRRQARAIEQALIEGHPEFTANKINSISPDRDRYDDAVEWGNAWLKYNGYLP